MAFLSLELTSICLYALTALSPRPVASEAALKYFLFGGISAGVTLFGISLLYGLTGSTALPEIAGAVTGAGQRGAVGAVSTNAPLFAVALVMTAAGFAFKVAAAPFHLWAPDVYQGAPVPSAALIASGSKVAGFFILAKVMVAGIGGAGSTPGPGFSPALGLVAVLCVVSIVIGNLAALAQSSIKRLLAYSAVAHAGYVLLGVMTPGPEGIASVVFYTVTYGLATMGAFGVIGAVEAGGGDDSFSSLGGLCRRSAFLSLCLLVFVLSLAGIPPLSGFFAKFWVFAAALRAGNQEIRLVWLVLLALAGSCVSLYYYLQILKQTYLRSPQPNTSALAVPLTTRISLGLAAAGVILLGCLPEPFLKALMSGH
jgi:NADH-quinone oxidoreductase subunit N